MSDVPTGPTGAPTGPGDPTSGEEPSEEEVRAYLGQLRAAPVDQVIAEVASALLNAAQVKLGRRDGRLLIDLVDVVTDQVRGRLPDELTSQLDDVVSRLQIAQVEAEREVDAAKSQGHEEPDDLPTGPAGSDEDRGGAATAPPAAGTQPPAQGQGDASAASRLWVPGR